MYNDCFHALHLDAKRIDVFNDIVGWIDKVLLSNAAAPCLTAVPKDILIDVPPIVVSWGKRLLYLSALALYLALGYMYAGEEPYGVDCIADIIRRSG
ncbi:MAG: hypothetical protein P4M11_03440 [Candidatus Pacebacteria bacterium]|nr:hypothetical protein [Candidatus Paceibacterota bacterium]